MKKINIYKYQELPEDVQEKIYNKWKEWREGCLDILPWSDETISSLKATIKHIGGELRDYSISAGGDRGDKIVVSLPEEIEATNELSTRRRYAWLENNILDPLRINYKITHPERKYCKYGQVPDCPFTGYFFDNVLLNYFISEFAKGSDIEDILENDFLRITQNVMYDDYEQELSKETFLDTENDTYYTIDGKEV